MFCGKSDSGVELPAAYANRALLHCHQMPRLTVEKRARSLYNNFVSVSIMIRVFSCLVRLLLQLKVKLLSYVGVFFFAAISDFFLSTTIASANFFYNYVFQVCNMAKHSFLLIYYRAPSLSVILKKLCHTWFRNDVGRACDYIGN